MSVPGRVSRTTKLRDKAKEGPRYYNGGSTEHRALVSSLLRQSWLVVGSGSSSIAVVVEGKFLSGGQKSWRFR